MGMETNIDKKTEHKSPILNGREVTFNYKGQAETVFVAGDYNQWELEDKMKKLENRDLWYINKQFPENARFDYKFILNFSKINLVLDYMIHKGEIPRLVAVLVDPHERTKEYTIYKPYYNYIIKELMHVVESRYMNHGDSLDRSVAGVSWGGLTSIYLAVSTPGKFKRVLSQSGSFWPKDWQIFNIIKEADTPQIKFCMQTGTIQDTEEMNDAMVSLLQAKGYTVDYMKYAESHSWGNWKGHLNEGLKRLYL